MVDPAVLGMAIIRMDSIMGPVCEYSWCNEEWTGKSKSLISPKELVRLYTISKMSVVPEAISFANVTTIVSDLQKDQLLICFVDKEKMPDYKPYWRRLRIITGKAKGDLERLVSSLQRLHERNDQLADCE